MEKVVRGTPLVIVSQRVDCIGQRVTGLGEDASHIVETGRNEGVAEQIVFRGSEAW